MTRQEYEQAKERLEEIEYEAEALLDAGDLLAEERNELEWAIEEYDKEQAALDE